LAEITDNLVHRALGELIYVGLVEATVRNLTITCRTGQISNTQPDKQDDKSQNNDQRGASFLRAKPFD